MSSSRLALLLLILPMRTVAAAEPAVPGAHLVTRTTAAMGTQVSVSVYTDDDEGAERAIAASLDEMARIEAMMTTWRDDSEVSRLNAQAGIAPVKLSPETMEVLEMAQKASAWSNGAFDVTFYALRGLWKFDEDLERRVPDAAQIQERLPLIGWKNLKLDAKKQTAFLTKKGMAVNLGGIAKGYAVDRMAAILRRAGFNNALVQAGGDLLCAGTKGGRPWSAGIRDPRGAMKDVFALILLEDHAFSTAGDYERSFLLDGKRYHHILDPRTGRPAMASRSVTVYAKTALLADALDDAIFILGWKRGFEMIEKIPDVGAVVVDADGSVHVSSRVQDRVKIFYTPKNEP
jgi:thiamine biosynthesis lipoprotein